MLERLLRPFQRAPSKAASLEGKAIVGHEGEWANDPCMMRLVVESIFRQSPLPEPLAALIDYLSERRTELADHDCLCDAIETWVKQDGVEEASRGAWLDALKAHRACYCTNAVAYKPEAKENWRACFYPDGSAPPPHGRSIYAEEEMPYARTYGFVTKQTPIGSAGSCFVSVMQTPSLTRFS
jgi:hypothetical protein